MLHTDSRGVNETISRGEGERNGVYDHLSQGEQGLLGELSVPQLL